MSGSGPPPTLLDHLKAFWPATKPQPTHSILLAPANTPLPLPRRGTPMQPSSPEVQAQVAGEAAPSLLRRRLRRSCCLAVDVRRHVRVWGRAGRSTREAEAVALCETPASAFATARTARPRTRYRPVLVPTPGPQACTHRSGREPRVVTLVLLFTCARARASPWAVGPFRRRRRGCGERCELRALCAGGGRFGAAANCGRAGLIVCSVFVSGCVVVVTVLLIAVASLLGEARPHARVRRRSVTAQADLSGGCYPK